MKMLKTLSLILTLFTAPIILGAKSTPLAPPQGSQVVLDWPEFIKLWEEANKTPEPPKPTPSPVDFILSRASYEGEVKPQATEITAQFDFQILNDDTWVRIPFLPQTLGLKQARLNGKPVAIAQENGHHNLVLKGEGQYKLEVIFSIPSPSLDGAPRLNFPVAQTAMTLLTMTFPKPKLDITINTAQVLTSKTENGKTIIQAILKPTQHVQVSWKNQRAPEKQMKPKIYANQLQLYSLQEAGLRLTTRITYSILHAGISRLRLDVPSDISILKVNGSNVENWQVEKVKGTQELVVLFNRKVKGTQIITIQSEVNTTKEVVTAFPFITTQNVQREEGAFALEAKSNVQVSPEVVKGLRQVDVKELPQDLWNMATSPLLYGFTFTQTKMDLVFNIEHHDNVPVLNSTIDSANAVTVLTKEGQWITRVSYQVRNHLKQFITLDIPEGAEIWSAFVSGHPVKPSRNKAGQILIPLEKSQLSQGNAAFPVEVIYYRQGDALGWVGQQEATLPQVDLPITQMLWSLYAPENYQFPHFGGNMDKSKTASGFYPVLLAKQDYSRSEVMNMNKEEKSQTVAKLKKNIRRSMAFKSARASGNGAGEFADMALDVQAVMELDTLRGAQLADDLSGQLENHVLPIAFRIPQVGVAYRFGKIMVTKSTPRISLSYTKMALIQGAKTLVMWIFIALVFFKRRALLTHIQSRTESVMKKFRKMNLAKSAA